MFSATRPVPSSSSGLVTSENEGLLKLARELGLEAQQQQISDIKARDIIGRIRIGNVDGVAELVGIERKRALQLTRRYIETTISGIEERKVLRTPDARKLEREILSLIAEGASSELARSKLLMLTPTLDAEMIRDRLNTCEEGQKILGELARAGYVDDLRRILAGLSFEITQAKKKGQVGESDTTRYFLSRKILISTAETVIKGFPKSQTLASFFNDIDSKALEEVLRIIEGIEGAEAKGAESSISDAEI